MLKEGMVMRTLLAAGVLWVCAASAWAYGDTESGKSTCAAMFSTPMLVLMMDSYDKATPYLEMVAT